MANETFMQRCIDLGGQGAGKVAPNPMVGCVIVHDNGIIGEGFHKQFGGAHAEVNAISSIQPWDLPFLKEATLYVNLEPCSHHGKTPPCADLIIEKHIRNVVIGTLDPNPLVAGEGIRKLRNSGCNVEVKVLESDCKKFNRRFFTWIENHRPYIILKWAQTTDGFIAPLAGKKISISNEYSRMLMHKWRSQEAGIMVGTNTALNDDPILDARMWNGNNPHRIVLDRTLRLHPSLHLFDHSVPTIVFSERHKSNEINLQFIQIDFNQSIIEQLLHHLYELQIQSLLVEGGTQLLKSFIDAGCWDEARIFITPNFFQEGVAAPRLNGTIISKTNIGTDQLITLIKN
jgi:diaminohydroxyphosphoribosylaminopyrimidine deaminase/5-amino-6-(5-phosphoribosylamino)uracil reductase